jgi:hypothetical protein
VLYSGETPDPPFTAALGLAAAPGFAFFGVRASSIEVFGETPEPTFSAALGLAAALGFLLRVGVLWLRCIRGKPPTPPSPLRSAWPLRSARPSACVRVGLPQSGGPQTPLFRCAGPGCCAWLLWKANKGRVCTYQAEI